MQITRMRKGKLVYPLMWVKLPYRGIGASICKVVEELADDLAITPEDVITDPVPAKELLTVEYPGELQMISFWKTGMGIFALRTSAISYRHQ